MTSNSEITVARVDNSGQLCLSCGFVPDKNWKTEGGETDDNIWETCLVCRECWAIFLKKESAEIQAKYLRESYSYSV